MDLLGSESENVDRYRNWFDPVSVFDRGAKKSVNSRVLQMNFGFACPFPLKFWIFANVRFFLQMNNSFAKFICKLRGGGGVCVCVSDILQLNLQMNFWIFANEFRFCLSCAS